MIIGVCPGPPGVGIMAPPGVGIMVEAGPTKVCISALMRLFLKASASAMSLSAVRVSAPEAAVPGVAAAAAGPPPGVACTAAAGPFTLGRCRWA
jgi:hypothetical protein